MKTISTGDCTREHTCAFDSNSIRNGGNEYHFMQDTFTILQIMHPDTLTILLIMHSDTLTLLQIMHPTTLTILQIMQICWQFCKLCMLQYIIIYKCSVLDLYTLWWNHLTCFYWENCQVVLWLQTGWDFNFSNYTICIYSHPTMHLELGPIYMYFDSFTNCAQYEFEHLAQGFSTNFYGRP